MPSQNGGGSRSGEGAPRAGMAGQAIGRSRFQHPACARIDWRLPCLAPYVLAMRPLRILAAAAAIAAAHRAAPASETPDGRQLMNLDPGWRFLAGDDAHAPDPGLDDRSW